MRIKASQRPPKDRRPGNCSFHFFLDNRGGESNSSIVSSVRGLGLF